MTYEINWDDLTKKAQVRLKNLYHLNICLNPIAIIEIDEEDKK